MTITRLITPPTPEAETQQKIIDVLERTLVEARAGKIDSVAMVIDYQDKTWNYVCSATMTKSKSIGQLFVALLARAGVKFDE